MNTRTAFLLVATILITGCSEFDAGPLRIDIIALRVTEPPDALVTFRTTNTGSDDVWRLDVNPGAAYYTQEGYYGAGVWRIDPAESHIGKLFDNEEILPASHFADRTMRIDVGGGLSGSNASGPFPHYRISLIVYPAKIAP